METGNSHSSELLGCTNDLKWARIQLHEFVPSLLQLESGQLLVGRHGTNILCSVKTSCSVFATS